MNLYSRARKHIDMKRVKEIHEEKIKERIEQIVLQEQEYLLHFTQNVVPKHYDWRTGKFNENSLEEINKIVLNRLEEIDNALSEGMSSKDFKYLYGGVATYDIVSINPTTVSSTFAQNLIGASNEVTSYMFGPNFPGSHINSIGDHQVDSSRQVNVNAYYDSTFGTVSGNGRDYTLRTVDGPSGASAPSLESALGITLPIGVPNDIFDGIPQEGSAVQRTFTGAKPGNVINFNWRFASAEKDLADDIKVDDYAFVAISGRVTKFVSILTNGDAKGGSFKYRLQPSDIDANGNVKVSIGVIDVYDDIFDTVLKVSNFGSLYAGDIGSIGDTTDAADLGTSVNNLNPNKKKKKQPQQSQQSQQPQQPNQTDDKSINPNLFGRGLRSATDQIRYGGNMMFQGNPAVRSPGLSNYWSPDPATAGTYSNPGAGKGVPGAKPNPTGTITSAPRPANTPRVTRSPLGQPQFKFPAGSPPPANMITQMADDAAVSAGKKAAATTAGKTLGKVVPFVSTGIAVADAGIRVSKGDYAGAVLSGLSAIPGPAGWAALGVQIATDAAGVTGVREQKEFTDYSDYLKNAGELAKKNNIELDRNAMLDSFLRQIAKTKNLSNNDKSFLVAIFTDAEGLEKDDVITFVKKIQKKLMNGKSIKEQLYPGQPSPNGFPDTPPPQLAPNGYHPEFGKRMDRYRRLDPISAKTMNKVGTDDPETNKQVSAAAVKGKKESTWGKLKKRRRS